MTVVSTTLASIYWLIPVFTGTGVEGSAVAHATEVDLRGFQTVADPHLGIIPNVLGLYGFWAEATYRFHSLKEFVPFWPVVLAALLLLAVIGIAAAVFNRPVPFEGAGAWVLGLALAGTAAIVLDIGIADAHVAPFVRWLDAAFPPYRGMRDAGKWGSLMALCYSQLIPLGVVALVSWAGRLPARRGHGLLEGGIIALGLALPLYYGNGVLFGLHGQIRPSAYPPGWYEADRVVASDPEPGKAVFLPWHLYLSLSFVKNANHVVASPAPYFFSVPVVISSNPEYPPIAHPEDADQLAVSNLVASGPRADWALGLANRNIEYIILAREVDWRGYAYLDNQPGLQLIADYGSIILYRNGLWHHTRTPMSQPLTHWSLAASRRPETNTSEVRMRSYFSVRDKRLAGGRVLVW
jgi:hypothetical protein